MNELVAKISSSVKYMRLLRLKYLALIQHNTSMVTIKIFWMNYWVFLIICNYFIEK